MRAPCNRAVLAEALTRRGLPGCTPCVLVEYPGYGKREGRAAARGALSASPDDLALACSRLPEAMYVMGESFGAGVATQVAGSRTDEIGGVLLSTPWGSLASVVTAKLLISLDILPHHRFIARQDPTLAGMSLRSMPGVAARLVPILKTATPTMAG